MSLETLLVAAIGLLVGVVAYLFLRTRRNAVDLAAAESNRRGREEVDTVAAWPPEVTRLLTSGERSAHEVLLKALPECFIFAQVPLSRFIKVPRRHSYAEWLARAGYLCADLLICDRASLVIGAVLLQTTRESERGERRRARMTRVLKAAGVKVFVWREASLPSAELAREQIIQRTGVPNTVPVVEVTSPRPMRPPAVGRGGIPVPEVVAELVDDGTRLEPPPTTWFDDLDSGRVPLDPERRPQGQGR
jgi:hypothetical protein